MIILLLGLFFPIYVSGVQLMGDHANEGEICAPFKGEGYCDASWLDDGAIRFTVLKSFSSQCCKIQRYNLSDGRIDFDVLACDPLVVGQISCSKYDKMPQYGESFSVDGRILTIYKNVDEGKDD
ncbi:hypothetical protein GCM10007315_14090 [Gemmobacter tilapiae]|uniref:Uncharacterized protein n=2 Tax=Neogemmobacter tilapiae TaxID=875041 RepID=A0A918TL50_9RHOB|nr:hypothetical protein GCM10007315_14090 [Gemmobacter tilapiae]